MGSLRGASKYELQLATSRRFNEATLFNTSTTTVPVASIQVQVPWMTGNPYALWVRVRALSGSRTSHWSTPFGFNTRWRTLPERRTSTDGLIHWSPVAGATGLRSAVPRRPRRLQRPLLDDHERRRRARVLVVLSRGNGRERQVARARRACSSAPPRSRTACRSRSTGRTRPSTRPSPPPPTRRRRSRGSPPPPTSTRRPVQCTRTS